MKNNKKRKKDSKEKGMGATKICKCEREILEKNKRAKEEEY